MQSSSPPQPQLADPETATVSGADGDTRKAGIFGPFLSRLAGLSTFWRTKADVEEDKDELYAFPIEVEAGVIGGRVTAFALFYPFTKHNWMSKRYAEERLFISHYPKISKTGDSETQKAIGKLELSWTCHDLSPDEQKSKFYIAPDARFDVLFGSRTGSRLGNVKDKWTPKALGGNGISGRGASQQGADHRQELRDAARGHKTFEDGIRHGILLRVDDRVRDPKDSMLFPSLADLETHLAAVTDQNSQTRSPDTKQPVRGDNLEAKESTQEHPVVLEGTGPQESAPSTGLMRQELEHSRRNSECFSTFGSESSRRPSYCLSTAATSVVDDLELGAGQPKCDICHTTFGRSSDLLRHKEEAHQTPMRCPSSDCRFVTKRKHRLRQHILKCDSLPKIDIIEKSLIHSQDPAVDISEGRTLLESSSPTHFYPMRSTSLFLEKDWDVPPAPERYGYDTSSNPRPYSREMAYAKAPKHPDSTVYSETQSVDLSASGFGDYTLDPIPSFSSRHERAPRPTIENTPRAIREATAGEESPLETGDFSLCHIRSMSDATDESADSRPRSEGKDLFPPS